VFQEVNKMEAILIAIVTLAVLVALFPVAFVWYLNIGGVYAAVREARGKSRQKISCRIDSDCPTGYVCVNGECIQIQ
jgi:hypothetical protein